jgi:hypothetical protein
MSSTLVKVERPDLVDSVMKPSNDTRTVMKYIGPRTIGINHTNNFQGSLRNFALANLRSTANVTLTTATASHGLASLIPNQTFTSLSPMPSIDGQRVIDEYRELTKLNQTLTDTILACCDLDAHNRAQELQLDWLQNQANKNSSTIEQMFRNEIENGKQLKVDAQRSKPDLEHRLDDVQRTKMANGEFYKQLLDKRDENSQTIFEQQRRLAQNTAEIEFIRLRLGEFYDEHQFYTLKNKSLHNRQVKLRYEYDEEMFARQVLQMEFEVLNNEKITGDDIHASSLDEQRNSIDIQQISTIQPLNVYREQLTSQLRHIRSEYANKIDVYREELHRRFELEMHRYEMQRARPMPVVNNEHEQRLAQYRREKKDVEQQIGQVHVRIREIETNIETIERRINMEKVSDETFESMRQRLNMFKQIIDERERQLNDAIRHRKAMKQQIDNYRERIQRYPTRAARWSMDFVHERSLSTNQQQVQTRSSSIEPSRTNNVRVQHADVNIERGRTDIVQFAQRLNVVSLVSR